MPGLGTIINAGAIVAAGILGILFGRFLTDRCQETVKVSCGVCVLFIGIAGAMEGMLSIEQEGLASGRSLLVTGSICLGALIGELINMEGLFERFGTWLKIRTGNSRDKQFVEGFVNASLTVCVGAMAVVGSIQDGLLGDPSILVTKAVLDFVIIVIMTCSQGKGCVFSAIPVAAVQGLITLLAGFIRPVMTEAALDNLSMTGSVLIFCVGLNLVWGRKIRVANLLPSLVLAVAFSFLPC